MIKIIIAIVIVFNVQVGLAAQRVCAVVENFDASDGGWETSSLNNCKRGSFELGVPNYMESRSVITQLQGDHTGQSGQALFTQVNKRPGRHDVDRGACVIESPDYQLQNDSEISLWYFHGQRDTGDDPDGDYFKIEYSTDLGQRWTEMVFHGDEMLNAQWTESINEVGGGQTVRLRVSVSDGKGRGLWDVIEGGIDDLSICEIEDPAPKGPKVIITIEEDAIYQVSGADLVANDIDFIGVDINKISLTHQGNPVPYVIEEISTEFSLNTVIRFHGSPASSIYTDTTTYALQSNVETALQVSQLDDGLSQSTVTSIRSAIINETLYTGDAEYLIITPSQFNSALDELVELREQEYSVKVVDVEDLYDAFGDGMFGGHAVKNYIKFAAENLLTKMVLLVGDDQSNYKDPNGWSGFVPTLYVPTNGFPGDPLLGDIDDDLIQDIAIGRFPVHNTEEVTNIIQKTIAYSQVQLPRTAMVLEKAVTSNLASHYRIISLQNALSDWVLTPIIDTDILGSSASRAQLINSINQGTGLVYWLGGHTAHDWSDVFGSNDVASLTNSNMPTVIMHEDSYQHHFTSGSVKLAETLMNSESGAVISLGTSGLFGGVNTGYANIFAANKTIGEALIDYQQNSAVSYIEASKYGYNLFGDPAVQIRN